MTITDDGPAAGTTAWFPDPAHPGEFIEGVLGQVAPISDDPLRSRDQTWHYEIWDRDGYTGENLRGITGGQLAWQKNQAIKGQGSLEAMERSYRSLLSVFIRPVLTLQARDGSDPIVQPYGLWVPSFPKRSFASAGWTGQISLVTREALLSYVSCASVVNTNNDVTVVIPQGTVVTDWIAAALAKAGQDRVAIRSSPKTESAPQAYTNGETLLQVINTELKRIGYASLYSDMEGTFRADPYVLPGDRSESFHNLRPFDVVDGNSILLSAFDFTDDSPNVPNRVRAVGQPVGWLAGQSAVAVNNDPASPYSVPNRGYVVEKVYTGVNALSQAEVQSYANQQLLNLSKDGRKAEIQFLHLPGAAINQVFYFNVPRAGDDMFTTMDALSVNLAPTGLSGATLTSITAVQDDDDVDQ